MSEVCVLQSVHPWVIQTELTRYMDPEHLQGLREQINNQLAAEGKGPLPWKTVQQGAATSVWAGVVASAEEIGGSAFSGRLAVPIARQGTLPIYRSE